MRQPCNLLPAQSSGLKELLEEFSGGRALNDSKTALASSLEKAQSELDARGFDLLQEEFNYDMQCFEVFLANRASHATAVLHQKNLWHRKLLDESRAAADAWWERYVA